MMMCTDNRVKPFQSMQLYLKNYNKKKLNVVGVDNCVLLW